MLVFIVLFLFGVLFICTIIVVISHTVNTHKRLRKNKHILNRNLARVFSDTVSESDVSLQKDRDEILKEWYRMIASAKRSVVFSTYHWFTHRQRSGFPCDEEVSPQVLILGLGLKKSQLQQNNPEVKILINKDPWVTRKFINYQIKHCLAVWKKLGVSLDNIDFRVFEQRWAGNMHIKILSVDATSVNVSSGNVQYGVETNREEDTPERKIPHKEGENAITVSQNMGVVYKLEDVVLEFFRKAKRFEFSELRLNKIEELYCLKKSSFVLWYGAGAASEKTLFKNKGRVSLSKLQNILESETIKQTKIFKACQVKTLVTKPVDSLWNTQWNAEYNDVIEIIRAARQRIVVMSPNFSDLTVWAELANKVRQNVNVTVVTGKKFNQKHGVVKWLTGMRSNMEMFERHCRPFHKKLSEAEKKKFSWFWYGFEQKATLSTAPRCAHHKVFLVDQDIFATGSLNLHVFGIYNVAEAMVLVKSKEATKQMEQDLVVPRIHHAQKAF
eukprot:COSAG01_NODE_5485_length_4230_cov_3.169450_2_plen_499_part_00